MAEGVEVNIRDCHVSAESGSHKGCIATYDTCTEHKHFSRFNTRHTTEEHSASPLRFLKETGTLLNGHSSCHFTHRHQERETMIAVSHCLVGDTYRSTFYHGLGQLKVACKMEIGEEHLSFANKGILRSNRLLHLNNHLPTSIYILYCREDSCSGRFIFSVRESAPFAGSVLHEHLMTVSYKFLHTRRGSTNPVFVILNLFWNADFHK